MHMCVYVCIYIRQVRGRGGAVHAGRRITRAKSGVNTRITHAKRGVSRSVGGTAPFTQGDAADVVAWVRIGSNPAIQVYLYLFLST